MKKGITLGLLLFGAILLTGCGQQQVNKNQSTNDLPASVVQQPVVNENQNTITQKMKETNTWKIFKDDKIGFSLKYPSDMVGKKIGMLQESPETLGLKIQHLLLPITQAAGIPPNLYKFKSNSLILDIQTQKIADMDEDRPMFGPTYQKEIMLSDMEKLAHGEYGKPMGNISKSQKLVYLFNSLYGKEYATMRQFEICDVQLTNQLVFYRNGYAIGVTLQEGDIQKVKTQLPQYFTTNPENCGDYLIWKEGQEIQFYNDLENGTISSTSEAGIWYKTFEQIVSSIELFDV